MSMKCSLCGQPLACRPYTDYDDVQYHCWKYHPGVYNSYDGYDRRKIILSSKKR